MRRFLYIFLDGVGLAPAAPSNPFTPYLPENSNAENITNNLAEIQPVPFLFDLLGGPFLAGLQVEQPNLLLKTFDATLGVEGLPQSATGQTTLYTGRNAPQFLGRHLTGFANGSLRILIEESGIFKQVQALGGKAALANLYTPAYFEAIAKRRLRYAVGTLLAMTANVKLRMPEDLERERAVNWDITNRYLGMRGVDAPLISPQEAGRRLANIAKDYNITLFECFLTDYAGHDQNLEQAREVIGMVDAFLAGLYAAIDPDITIVLSSDHGNIEDLSRKTHTLNPVPLLVIGPDALAFSHLTDISQITPTIIDLLK